MEGLLDFDHLCVVLVAARNPLNIGAAARAMSNFGFRRLRVVNPYSVAFREARSAVGAVEVLARAEEYASLAEAVADCTLVVGTSALHHRELRHPVHRLEQGAELIRQQLRAGRVALVFGSEKRGLSKENLSYCHWLLHVSTREEHASMNLGQAVAVCVYELARSSPVRIEAAGQPATSGDLERISQLLFESLHASGYVKKGAEEAASEKLRHLVRRLGLRADDAELLLGMLRKILRKLRQIH